MIRDERGNSLAFGIVMAAIFLVGAAVLYAMFIVPYNISFIPAFNGIITSVVPSQMTVDTFSFYRNATVAIPIFILIGLLLWAWVRGLEARN